MALSSGMLRNEKRLKYRLPVLIGHLQHEAELLVEQWRYNRFQEIASGNHLRRYVQIQSTIASKCLF